MSLGNEQLLTPFVASTLLQPWARQIPRPTAPLRRRLRRWSHSSFPATPPSGWRNCPKSSTPGNFAIQMAVLQGSWNETTGVGASAVGRWAEEFAEPTFEEEWKRDRKSTRLNSSHGYISYAVFCLKKKKIETNHHLMTIL